MKFRNNPQVPLDSSPRPPQQRAWVRILRWLVIETSLILLKLFILEPIVREVTKHLGLS